MPAQTLAEAVAFESSRAAVSSHPASVCGAQACTTLHPTPGALKPSTGPPGLALGGRRSGGPAGGGGARSSRYISNRAEPTRCIHCIPQQSPLRAVVRQASISGKQASLPSHVPYPREPPLPRQSKPGGSLRVCSHIYRVKSNLNVSVTGWATQERRHKRFALGHGESFPVFLAGYDRSCS